MFKCHETKFYENKTLNNYIKNSTDNSMKRFVEFKSKPSLLIKCNDNKNLTSFIFVLSYNLMK
jgi:hypothetical protein